ncbi:MAG TPA: hypothetical protein VFT23_00785 [Burkholderiales bacterium]|nr:hypothetical protein [Burkholderiales bacterium]
MMGVVLFLLALPASAGPVIDTWTDPAGDILLDLDNSDEPIPGVNASYEYQHDITNDGFAIGDTITSATLYVSVRDAGGSEIYQYEIGLGPEQADIFSNVPNNRIDQILLGALSLADLQNDGIIDVVIRITEDSNNQEGLYFVSSRLVAQVDAIGVPPTQVPEPWTLALMAFGLLIGGSFSARPDLFRGRS